MKEKTAAALRTLLDFVLENPAFILIWAVSLAIILRLAWV